MRRSSLRADGLDRYYHKLMAGGGVNGRPLAGLSREDEVDLLADSQLLPGREEE